MLRLVWRVGTVVEAIDLVVVVGNWRPHSVSNPYQGMSVCLSDVVLCISLGRVIVLHVVVLLESVILMMHFHVMWVVVVRVAREILHAMMICFEPLLVLV